MSPKFAQVRIRDDLKRLAKGAASHAGITLSEWLDVAIQHELQRVLVEATGLNKEERGQ